MNKFETDKKFKNLKIFHKKFFIIFIHNTF
jgi:hypothetical protein